MRYTTWNNLIHQQAMTESRCVGAQPKFAQAGKLYLREHKSDIITDRANIADVVRDTFPFRQNAAYQSGARRNFNARSLFHCHTGRPAMSDGGIAGNTPSQPG